METAVLMLVGAALFAVPAYFALDYRGRLIVMGYEKSARDAEVNKLETGMALFEAQVAELKAQLEQKNTRPASSEPRRIRARSMSEAEQMAQAEYAKKA